MTFNPIDGKFFSFYLQKLQHIDNFEYINNQGDNEQAPTTQGTNTTSYSMMVLVESEDNENFES